LLIHGIQDLFVLSLLLFIGKYAGRLKQRLRKKKGSLLNGIIFPQKLALSLWQL